MGTLYFPFFELGGKALSLNVDFRKKESYAISVGIIPEGFTPNVMGYYFGGKLHRLELGGGFSLSFGKKMKLDLIWLYGVVGYRFQKQNGLFFRAGFTPFFVKSINYEEKIQELWPFAGVSIGYSFKIKKK
jgi:hypothetical protein